MDRYTYTVEIRVDDKHSAYLKVTQIPKEVITKIPNRPPSLPRPSLIQDEFVYALFANVEKKARKRAKQIVDQWRAKDLAEQKKIVYEL